MNTYRTRRWVAAAVIAAATVTGTVAAVAAADGDSNGSPAARDKTPAEVVELMPAGWPATEVMRQDLP